MIRRLAPAVLLLSLACNDAGQPAGLSGTPAQVAKVAGDAQQATIATAVATQPTVEVRDENGRAVANAKVTFDVVGGGGFVYPRTEQTDADGRAATYWYMGPRSGAGRMRASAGSWSAEFTATATALEPDRAYFGAQQYIEFIPGDLPIVISAPHGGQLMPGAIPNRTNPNATTVRDTNTEELAREIAARFRARLGAAPSIIICRLDRRKIDVNREIGEATEGHPLAQRAWYEWHGFIEAARARVVDTRGKGFYIDLHGHGHAIRRLELGYMLTSAQLARSDAELNSETMMTESSIRTLAGGGARTHAQLLRGPTSLGTLFEARGIPAVPSTAQPSPGADPYFSGGYNTGRHGSRVGGSIDGVQIESHFMGVRDSETNRTRFADALVDAMLVYFAENYDMPLVAPAATRAHMAAAPFILTGAIR